MSGHTVELDAVLAQARDIARLTGQVQNTAHVLLAMFTVPNRAEALLLSRRVNEETVLAHIERIEAEPAEALQDLLHRARYLAGEQGEGFVDCLHVLAALTRMPSSFAYRLVARTGVNLTRLRSAALNHARAQGADRLAPIERGERARIDADLVGYIRDTIEYPALPADGLPVLPAADEEESATEDVAVVQNTRRPSEPLSTGRDTQEARALDTRPARRPERDRRAGDRAGRRRTDRGTGRDPGDRRRLGAGAEAEAAPKSVTGPSPFVLNRERFPTLTKLGRNLSHLAWLGQLDPVIGREREIVEALDVLHKRRSNNPCLVGDPGVGKTSVAEGVAAHLAARHPGDDTPPERVIIQIDVGAILAGTHLRGALAERLRALRDEVRDAHGRVVIFIDEIHTLLSASGEGHDAANELKTALSRGEFPCIGATTVDEYRTSIETDPALERRFAAVHIEAPDAATTRKIVAGITGRYAAHHQVQYTPEAVDTAVQLARRYIHDRNDPDRTLSVLDLAGAVARRAGGEVDKAAVCEVIARTARVPVEHLLMDDPQRFLEMEAQLGQEIIGQAHVLTAVAETIRRNLAGFAGGRPIGSFLFLGPTGVGKTQVVKALARFLFGQRDALTRFDMSEFLEAHTVSRLIGSPPGYVGHQEGGQLTDAVRRRPYQVVLFDEIEKSHRDVWNVLLQILDEGRLTDSKGRTVDFSNTLVVLTSNLGADALIPGKRIGFAGAAAGDADARAAKALDKAKSTFPPELWNRIESRLVFHPLSRDEVRRITHLMVAERSAVIERERDIRFSLTDAAVDWLVERGGYDAALGARPMRQALAREVESRLAQQILAGTLSPGDAVVVDAVAADLVISPAG